MKPKFFFLLLLSLYIVNCTLTIATVRYVSKTGTSTPPYTSWQTAADSIQKCINICVDGDTIYVANGIYKENLVINTAISLIGSSMDSTVIDGTGLGDLTITINNNFSIENFNVYGKGKGVSGSRVVWAAIPLTFIEIKNCKISEAARGVSSVSSNLTANNLFMVNLNGGFSLVSGNWINWIISNCVILLDENNSNGITIGFAQYADANINNNIILYNRQLSIYTGDGISLGLPKKVYISNNLISGFTDNIYVDDVIDTVFINNNALIYQNTLSSNPASIFGSGDIVGVNNVTLSKNKKAIYGGLIKSDYNIFWDNQIDLEGLAYGDSDRVADPMFVKDTLPDSNFNFDFHLQAFSPGIDKGDPNILDIDGSRSDIGMYGGPFGETYTYQDLAPLAPRNLSALVDTNQIFLKWNKNTEADTAYYKVYRDTTINFTIDSTKLIASPTDTNFIQYPPYIGSKYVYKVTCVDSQGNESNPSEEIIIDLTSVSTDDYPMSISDYVLYQNYPNPFNPSTKIGYQLKERAYVKLMVYDIKGEFVSALVNKEQNAGYYEVEFSSSSIQNPVSSIKGLASGIYLYRIEVIGEGKIPVYTEMKKMILIK